MKKSFRYSLLITLTLLVFIGLVNAQPIPIGTFEQDRPYESNPTVVTGNIPGSGAERDGSLVTSWAMQGPAAAGSGTAFISGFTIPAPAQQFPIGWVDIKIKYKHPGLGDDGYHMGYKTSGTIYTWLQTTLTGPAAKFDATGAAAVRPWPNVARTGGGAWTWTDVQNLFIRIIVTRGANAVWDAFLDLYEVWVTVYEHAPPSSSTAMSVMPGASNISIVSLEAGKYFFADVYLNGLTGGSGQLWGYQATIKYDESIVTAISYFSYYPFTVAAPSAINPGYVSVSYTMQSGDLVGFTGTATPLCRVYFVVDQGGATPLDLVDLKPTYVTEFTDPFGNPTVPPLYDGWLSSPLYLSAQPPVLIDLTSPLTTTWHEDYPNWSNTWHLTSWEDVSPLNPGELGPSDQIDMTNETGWIHWFHVENVTITIHWTLKEGEGGDPIPGEIGVAEPEVPMLDMPLGSPVGSTWHMIYPTYCQWITISSWVDSDGSGDFNPSDQFDYTLGAGDVLLAGTAPAPGSPLTSHAATGQQIMYWDMDYSGTWDPGEPCFDDVDWDTFYVSYMDTLLVGPAIPDWTGGSYPGALATFHDADYSYWWDPGEPAIRDVNSNFIYDVATTYWAHLDAVSTDIIVCQKPIPPYIGEPEFPLGISLLLLIAPIIPLTYLWRLRKKVTRQ